jgi:hypothetical protein
MCLSKSELSLYPVTEKVGWFRTKREWEGIGFKAYGHRKDGSLIPVLSFTNLHLNRWLTAEADYEKEKDYFAGFHIFLRKEDAITYAKGWAFENPGIYHVRYRDVMGFGNQYLMNGSGYGRCVIAARMLICKDTMSKIGEWE